MIKLRSAADAKEAMKAARIIFNLELHFHKGNKKETHQCLKQHLGTNENTQAFYSLLSTKEYFGWLKKKIMQITFFERLLAFYQNSDFVLKCKNMVKIILHLILYSWDLIKDIYFLIVYAGFFPVSRNDFNTFGFQIFFILMLSILVPIVLNLFVLLLESPAHLTLKGKLILVSFSVVSQSAIGYVIGRVRISKEKILKHYGKWSLHEHSEKLVETISRLEHQSQRLAKLQSKLRSNEGIFESSIQALILLTAIAIHFRYKQMIYFDLRLP